MSNTLDGIAYEDLYLVRVKQTMARVRMDGDTLVLGRRDVNDPSVRNTGHFTLNGIVTDHVYGGGWNNADFVFVAQMDRACKEGGNHPSSISPADTYFHYDSKGEIRLPGGVVLAPDDVNLPEEFQGHVVRYPRGTDAEAHQRNRNKALAELFTTLDVPLRPVGQDSWRNGDGTESWIARQDYEGLQRSLDLRHYCDTGSRHSLNADGQWEDELRELHKRMTRYSEGEKIWGESWHPAERRLYDVIGEALPDLRGFIDKQKQNNASPQAVEFYEAGLKRATARFEATILPERRKDCFGRLGDEYYVHDGKTHQGPFNAAALLERVQDGSVNDETPLWYPGETAWKAFGKTQDRTLIHEILDLDQRIGQAARSAVVPGAMPSAQPS